MKSRHWSPFSPRRGPASLTAPTSLLTGRSAKRSWITKGAQCREPSKGSTAMTDATGTAELRPLQVEANGINVIAESERKGHPHDLFWPWFAANVSVLGISYGSFVLGFGISFWQAAIVGVVGVLVAFPALGVLGGGGQGGPR